MYALVRFSLIALLAVGCAKKAETAPPVPAPAPAKAAPADDFKTGPIIEPVHFASGSTTIDATEVAAIDKAAEIMKSSDWTVLVLGLADATGDAETNKVLSQQRADAVAAELRTRIPNVNADRVKVHSIGEKLATGSSEAERKVEFVFYSGGQGLGLKEIVVKSRVLEEDFRAKH